MMKKIMAFSLGVLLCAVAIVISLDVDSAGAATRVSLETTKGNIVLELDEAKAPITVKNFLDYADSGYFEGTIFHRVIKRFMIQGGGMDKELNPKATRAPIKNEADNGLLNMRGAIAMARTGVIDSATSQFFINTKNNPNLNHNAKTERGWGYAVFGKVVEGMDVVDAIEGTPTGTFKRFRDVPKETITILKVTRVD